MEDKDRTIVAEIPGCYFDVDPSSGALTPQLDKYSGGWIVPSTAPVGVVMYEESIDLSGYAMEDLTFSPYASFKQIGGYTTFNDGVGFIRYDCISSVPMDLTELYTLVAIGGGPGFISPFPNTLALTNVNRDVVIHGDLQIYAKDVNYPGTNFMTERDSFISSSLEPTAADKLYVYSVIILDANLDADPSAVPPVLPYGTYLANAPRRLVMPGRWTQEPELEYMMRLKRSYELANQV